MATAAEASSGEELAASFVPKAAAVGVSEAAGKAASLLLPKVGLVASVGIEALADAFSVYEYCHGRMDRTEFETQMIGSGIFLACTATGAAVGAVGGGIGAVPGAAIGAFFGTLGQLGYTIYKSWHAIVSWGRSHDYSPVLLGRSVYFGAKRCAYGVVGKVKGYFGKPSQSQELLRFLLAYYRSPTGK